MGSLEGDIGVICINLAAHVRPLFCFRVFHLLRLFQRLLYYIPACPPIPSTQRKRSNPNTLLPLLPFPSPHLANNIKDQQSSKENHSSHPKARQVPDSLLFLLRLRTNRIASSVRLLLPVNIHDKQCLADSAAAAAGAIVVTINFGKNTATVQCGIVEPASNRPVRQAGRRFTAQAVSTIRACRSRLSPVARLLSFSRASTAAAAITRPAAVVALLDGMGARLLNADCGSRAQAHGAMRVGQQSKNSLVATSFHHFINATRRAASTPHQRQRLTEVSSSYCVGRPPFQLKLLDWLLCSLACLSNAKHRHYCEQSSRPRKVEATWIEIIN